MMLAGLPFPPDAVEELATLVRDVGADDLADRLERALVDAYVRWNCRTTDFRPASSRMRAARLDLPERDSC